MQQDTTVLGIQYNIVTIVRTVERSLRYTWELICLILQTFHESIICIYIQNMCYTHIQMQY